MKTLTFCTFYTINHFDFVNLLKTHFPADYVPKTSYFTKNNKIQIQEKFCLIRDLFLLERHCENFFKPCYSCKNPSHLLEDCPFLHFVPDVDLTIKKHIYTAPIERDPHFKRRPRFFSHINSLKYRSNLHVLQEDFEKKGKDLINQQLDENYSTTIAAGSSCIIEEEELYNDFQEDIPLCAPNEQKDGCLEIIDIHSKNSKEKEEVKELSPKTKKRSIIIKSMKECCDNNSSSSHTLHQFAKNENFEREFLLNWYLRRKLFIKELKLADIEIQGFDLFNFEFEKAKHYNIYLPNYNIENIMKKYKKFARRKENKLRKMRCGLLKEKEDFKPSL